jgi:hypothetical protein
MKIQLTLPNSILLSVLIIAVAALTWKGVLPVAVITAIVGWLFPSPVMPVPVVAPELPVGAVKS